MKQRFSTLDIICLNAELRQKLIGMRCQQVYDVDHKTYLFKLQRTDEKVVLLIESGTRYHTTTFEWPKNDAPSSFSMKLRKHLKNKRLEDISQVGNDRVLNLQFGTGEAAYHVLLELYDRGNVALVDHQYNILNVLRPRKEGETLRLVVGEKYHTEEAKSEVGIPSDELLRDILVAAKDGDLLRKVLNPHLCFGPALIDHVFLDSNFPSQCKIGHDFKLAEHFSLLKLALEKAQQIMNDAAVGEHKGYIIKRRDKRAQSEEDLLTFEEFHPMLFRQHENQLYEEFQSFDRSVDEFFSQLEGQKLERKTVHQEREAIKKLANVKDNFVKRVEGLQKEQELDRVKGELIEMNVELVEHALGAICHAIARQLSWPDIEAMVAEAKSRDDPVAKYIHALKLETNRISMKLKDPYSDDPEIHIVDLDLDLTAYANARKYYDDKRQAARKEKKTTESETRAFKSAEKKTLQALKQVQKNVTINKARKSFWFEKFLWFISSENYLVIAGSDRQQNEYIVKRHLRRGDIYVHADIHGAASVIIKNPYERPVPPKTLNEAGVMAICYSHAWETKVVTNAYWVEYDQVSKTAPTGEYLTTGAFMIRGKKNFLPPCQLTLGFGFLFRLEESSVERHKEDRKVRTTEEELVSEVFSEQELIISDEEHDDTASGVTDAPDVKPMQEEQKLYAQEFPDTVIAIEHVAGDQFALRPRLSESESTKSGSKTSKSQSSQKKKEIQPLEVEETHEHSTKKRGQHSRKKKINNKYRDQDEEEREIRMAILQSAGSKKAPKKASEKGKRVQQEQKREYREKVPQPPKEKAAAPAEELDEEDDEDDVARTREELEIVNCLTGSPVMEDELLFALPVVAPYNTLSNYKYKVKLMPGTGKRGKATKMALKVFLGDRNGTTREKDLLRSVKDQDMARNFPGKVKVSVPQSVLTASKRAN